jgi:hypothetical protein
MKRLLLTFTFITLFITAVCAQEHGQAAARPERPAARWLSYTSPEGRYTVSFGEAPKVGSQTGKAASGDIVQYMASATMGSSYLMVGYFDYPNSVTFSLDSARDGMVNSLHGTLMNEESISLGGAPGRSVKILSRADNGTEFIDLARLYDVNRRIYILQCLNTKAEEGPDTADVCATFFDSFKVKKY